MTDSLPDVVSAQGLDACIVDECSDEEIVGRGRCRKHYMQWWRKTRNSERPPALNLRRKTIADRFWEKVTRGAPDECWPWDGSCHHWSGHGEFFVSRERGRVPAHTFAIELATGEPCPEGQEGCHRCDNPPCCNPAHLYYGTRLQNMGDAVSRGRNAHGEGHGNAVLTEEDVVAIRVRFAAGETQPVLASVYGISAAHVSEIVNGIDWKHIGGPIKTHNKPGRRPNRKEVA